jgi:hypothetical protein
VTATPVGDAVLKTGPPARFHFTSLNCGDAAISIGRPKFSLEPTENVRLHGIDLDEDFFYMGTSTALKCAQAEHSARR